MSYPVGPRLAALANRILRNLDLIEAKATLNLTIRFGLVGPMSRRGEPERSPQRRARAAPPAPA